MAYEIKPWQNCSLPNEEDLSHNHILSFLLEIYYATVPANAILELNWIKFFSSIFSYAIPLIKLSPGYSHYIPFSRATNELSTPNPTFIKWWSAPLTVNLCCTCLATLCYNLPSCTSTNSKPSSTHYYRTQHRYLHRTATRWLVTSNVGRIHWFHLPIFLEENVRILSHPSPYHRQCPTNSLHPSHAIAPLNISFPRYCLPDLIITS